MVLSFDDDVPPWVRDELTHNYFLQEWQKVPRTNAALFEHLCLLIFQNGLWWSLVLAKREELRLALHGFRYDELASMTEADITAYLEGDLGIRNEAKLRACINNARVMQSSQVNLTDLFTAAFPTDMLHSTIEELPRTTDITDALSNELRTLGFQRLGPVVVCAVAQAAGYIKLASRLSTQRDRNMPVRPG